jgi:Mrp family chromosome partitioning ATPase/capsular polysaccharide biosynthesis protein
MTLERYWTVLIKQWKLIVICLVFVGLGAYIGSRLMTPLYQSSVLVEVSINSGNNQTQTDYTSLLASEQLVQTESQLAISDPVLIEVASHYKWLTVSQLAKEVTSSVKLNTQLFEIDVLDPDPKQAATLANDVAATLIKQQLNAAEQTNSKSQQQLQQDLDATQQKIDAITAQVGQLQTQETALLQQLQGQKGTPQNQQQVKDEAAVHAQIAVLQTQLTRLQEHYTQWQTALAQLELTEAQSGNFLFIAQPAQLGLTPVSPKILLNTAAGLVAGLFLGMLLAIMREQFDTRIRTSEALTQLLDWPILGTIQRVDRKEEIVNPSGHHANVEAYRILRTNIGFSMIDKPLQTFVVTSATPHEGKSTVAANLAIFMAKSGKNTLLIDADLRRPTVHAKFQLPVDKKGLSTAIMAVSQFQFVAPTPGLPLGQSSTPFSSSFSLEPYMHPVGIPNLRIMPSGPLPPNPPELLDSKVMERFFAAIAKCGAEVIIFDTPPLLGLSDASILMPKVDGAIVVVDITRANKKHLTQVKTILTNTGGHILGCVVNMQRQRRKDPAYSYYYYYGTQEPTEEGKSAKNGHVPGVSPSPLPPVSSSPFEQRTRAN